MTLEELRQAVELGYVGHFEGVDPGSATELAAGLVVGSLVAIPVNAISSRLNNSQDLEIQDEAGNSLGTLCFTIRLGLVDRNLLTRWQYVAFLTDADLAEVHTEQYSFKRNYVLVEQDRIDDYIGEYKSSAPLWGEFSHGSPATLEARVQPTSIQALPRVFLPTVHHEEALRRYVSATNSFDRYLRLYHCLELLFDFVTFVRVKALGANLSGFAQLLSEHGRTELDRLKAIMREFCDRPQSIVQTFGLGAPYVVLMSTVFNQYSKAGDPIADPTKWNNLMAAVTRGELTAPAWKREKIIDSEGNFDKLVLDVSAYWIYRVRSSIAHSRVGEYLLEDQHAGFIQSFAEPLLMNVVTQVFSSAKFRALCN